MLIITSPIIFFIVLFIIVFSILSKEASRLKTYAEKNGGTYKAKLDSAPFKGIGILENAYAFYYVSLPDKYGNNEFFNQSENGIQRLYFSYTLPKTFPHIYIDSKTVNDNHPIKPQKSQSYSLEGVFGKYYDVYLLDDHAAETLSLLNPSTMEKILSYKHDVDIEVYGNRLTIISYQSLSANKRIEQYEQGRQLVADIVSNNHTVTSIPNSVVPVAAMPPKSLKITLQSSRLVRSIMHVAIYLLVLSILIASSALYGGKYFAYTFITVAVTIFIATILVSLQKSWLQNKILRLKRARKQDLKIYKK